MGVDGLEGRGGRKGLAALGRSKSEALSRRDGGRGTRGRQQERTDGGDRRGNAVEAGGDA